MYALLGFGWIILYFVILFKMTKNTRFRDLLRLVGVFVAIGTPILIYGL